MFQSFFFLFSHLVFGGFFISSFSLIFFLLLSSKISTVYLTILLISIAIDSDFSDRWKWFICRGVYILHALHNIFRESSSQWTKKKCSKWIKEQNCLRKEGFFQVVASLRLNLECNKVHNTHIEYMWLVNEKKATQIEAHEVNLLLNIMFAVRNFTNLDSFFVWHFST